MKRMRLKESQNTAASLTTLYENCMSSLVGTRARFEDQILKGYNIKLGFMSVFARVSVLALQDIPAVKVSTKSDSIVYRDYVDLIVGVTTPKGLVTPVLRNAEAMGFLDIGRRIAYSPRRRVMPH